MANLYLIRKSLETYTGPYSIAELREQYKQMDFGLQDEVCGSCGKWLTFDNVPALRRHYPDLAKLVQEEFLGGWGVSEPSIKVEISSRRSSSPKSRKKSVMGLGLSLVLVIIVLAVAALFVANGGRFDSRFFDKGEFPEIDAVKQNVETNDYYEFEQIMDGVMPRLLPKVARSRKTYNEWIPYLRLLAFRRDGTIPSIKPILIRGMGRFVAPSDCSLEAWKQRWTEGKNDWETFLSGQTLMNSDWAKILLWDPYWIRRRNRVEGWKKPINYYAGCLIMAQKALEDLKAKKAVVPPQAFFNRIAVQLAIIEGQNIQIENGSGYLGYMTCVEIAPTKNSLDACSKVFARDKELLIDRYIEQNRLRNEIRLFLKINDTFLTDDSLMTLSKLHGQLKPIDDSTGFTYQPEIKFLGAIMLNHGSINEAAERMRYDFQEVNFAL